MIGRLRPPLRARRRARTQLLPISAAIFLTGLLCIVSVPVLTRPRAASAPGATFAVRAAAPAPPPAAFSARPAVIPGLVREAKTLDANGYHDDFCAGPGFFKSNAALAIYVPVVLIMFVGLAIVTDDFFVPALEAICEQLSLSEDVAGATFMAAGSSAPELFASLLSVFVTKDDVGVGTVVGSAVFNILIIIGLSAALAGKVLHLDWRSLARDSSFYIISIAGLIIVLLGPSRGQVQWWEGMCMVFVYVFYILFMAFGNKPYMAATERFVSGLDTKNSDIEDGEAAPVDLPSSSDMPSSSDGTDGIHGVFGGPKTPPNADSPAAVDYRSLHARTQFRTAYLAVVAANRFAAGGDDGLGIGIADNSRGVSDATRGTGNLASGSENGEAESTFLGIDVPDGLFGKLFFPLILVWSLLFKYTIVQCGNPGKAKLWPVTFALSILWIGAISFALVESARMIGCLVGIPSVVMGLTVLAAGTSVPDALASVAVARMGHADMAVSNAIGSNVFDIAALGFAWCLGAFVEDQMVTVDPIATVIIPIVILFVIIVVLIGLLVALRWQLRPALGYILFGLYFVFILYTLLNSFVFKIGQKS